VEWRRFVRLEQELGEAPEMATDPAPELWDRGATEQDRLARELTALEQRIRLLLLPSDPNDSKNILLEIRGGTGGEEATLFAAELFRLYLRFAERKGWKVDIMSRSESSSGGLKEVIALIEGKSVYSHLKFESGVHRVQRVPATESQGRIHTSAATVAVLPEAEDVEVNIADSELRIDVMRAGGPGGQSVNTTDSAVRVTHLPTGMVVICQDEKSQTKNKAKAIKVLKARLLELEEQKQHAERTAERRSMVKSGDRSEKIRTYNFPQDRVTDHRIPMTWHNLGSVMEGDIEHIIEALRTHNQAELLGRGENEAL
ncbi:MAG: peptide chain release factor 1, partial [Polyangia bacterium]|jgi:peptide chain release factor 1|nr:peptide chain release factor 1 [Polyangia bacterium]